MRVDFHPVYDRDDPTRIPRLIEQLQRAWEGQPDLSLAALIGVLGNHGVGWGTTDNEAAGILRELEKKHPSLLDAHPAAPYLIRTTSPGRLVSLVDGLAVVRSAADAGAMPGVWVFDSLRRTGPGRPLVVRDGEGIEHRLGVVKLVTRLNADAGLGGLRVADAGERRWCVTFSDDSRAVVGRRIRVWQPHRRDVSTAEHSWLQVTRCAEGGEFAFLPAGGGAEVVLGEVQRCVLIESD